MLLCGRIVLVARFIPVLYPRSLEQNDYAREVHTSEYLLSMDPSLPEFLGCEAYLLRNARCASIPRTLCSSVESTCISAALYLGIRNQFASNSSIRQQVLFHPLLFGFFARLTVNLSALEHALFAEFASRLRFVIPTYNRMPIIT